jgi:hypothetical protein
MIRRSHLLLALALVAAAFAAPIARAQADPPSRTVTVPAWLSKIHYPGTSYPFNSVGIPASLARTHYPGTSVPFANTATCSQEVKPPSCYAMPAPSLAAPVADEPKPVDPLAVGYLTGRGLSPSEVASWTTGTCSQETRPASCYSMFDAAPAVSTQVSRSVGFQWADAGIGAGFALGVVLLLAGAGAGFLISRQARRRQTAHVGARAGV